MSLLLLFQPVPVVAVVPAAAVLTVAAQTPARQIGDLIDDFERSDEDPLDPGLWGPGWSDLDLFQLIDGAAFPREGEGATTSQRYIGDTFGPDCYVRSVFREPITATHAYHVELGVGLRISEGEYGVDVEAYGASVIADGLANPLQVWIYRVYDGDSFEILQTAELEQSEVDGIELRAVGTLLTASVLSGGVWEEACEATNSEITAAGYVGINRVGDVSHWDDMGIEEVYAGVAVSSGETVTVPDAGVLTATAEAPSAAERATSTAAALTAAAQTPAGLETAKPDNGVLTVASQAPSLLETAKPDTAAVTVTAQAPTADERATSTEALLTVEAQAPATYSVLVASVPAPAEITVAGQDPAGSQTAKPDTASLTVAAQDPAGSQRATATAGEVTVAAAAPAGSETANPDTGSLTVAAEAPVYRLAATATNAALSITAEAPTVGNQPIVVVAPDAVLTVTAQAATASETAKPDTANATVAAQATTLAHAAAAPNGALTVTGHAPAGLIVATVETAATLTITVASPATDEAEPELPTPAGRLDTVLAGRIAHATHGRSGPIVRSGSVSRRSPGSVSRPREGVIA